MRLKGLAASFQADELCEAAEAALQCAPGEPAVTRNIDAILNRLSASGR